MKTLKFILRPIVIVTTILVLGCTPNTKDAAPWSDIFNGIDLQGWSQLGGEAQYEVRNGAIVGMTVHGTPNSFLTTNKLYDDFILELEYKVDPSMNSCIQIGSNSFLKYMNGRVHGYQVEIDSSERAWSTGIYDESRRVWIVNALL